MIDGERMKRLWGSQRLAGGSAWLVIGVVGLVLFGVPAVMLLTSGSDPADTAGASGNGDSFANGNGERGETYIEGDFLLEPISGRVVSADGEPVAGARVWLHEQFSGYSGSDRAPSRSDDLAVVTTDDDGNFEFVDVPVAEEKANNTWMDMIVRAQGFAVGWRHFQYPADSSNIEVTLNPQADLSGRVVDNSGAPVPHATVRVKYAMSLRHILQADLEEGRWPRRDDAHFVDLSSARGRPAVRTDEDGQFYLTSLPAEQGIVLEVSHPQHVLTVAHAATVNRLADEDAAGAKRDVQTGPIRIAVDKARTLKVRVVYEDTGAPAAQARYPDILRHVTYPPRNEAGDNGEFEIRHLDRTKVALWVYPPKGSDYLAVIDSVAIPDGTYEMEHVVRLPRGAIVTGRVVDAETDKGIANVPLYATSPAARAISDHYAQPDHPIHPDADGRFRAAVIPGETTLVVHGQVPGYRTPQQGGSLAGIAGDAAAVKQTVTATLAQPVSDVVLKLQRAPLVERTVYDPQGNPAGGVLVSTRIWWPNRDASGLGGSEYREILKRTDAQGKFSIDNVSSASDGSSGDVKMVIIVHDQQRNLGVIVNSEPTAENDDTQNVSAAVHLKRLGKVTGRIVDDETGQPVPGTRVQLYMKDEGSRAQEMFFAVNPEVRTGPDGRFELPGVFDGPTHFVTITDGRYLSFNGWTTRFEGKGYELYDLGDLKLVTRGQ